MINTQSLRRIMPNVLLFLLVALFVSACGGPRKPAPMTAERAAELRSQSRYPDAPQVDATYMSFTPFFGFQVTYFGADGRNWLWFPGNTKSLPGEWKITGQETNAPQLCFRYPKKSYNPVTRQTGGKFKCTSLNGYYRRTVTNKLAGDPFNLASGTVPYIREQCDPPAEFGHRPEDIGPLFNTVSATGVCAK